MTYTALHPERNQQISQGHLFWTMIFGVIHGIIRTAYILTYMCMYMEDDFLKGKIFQTVGFANSQAFHSNIYFISHLIV